MNSHQNIFAMIIVFSLSSALAIADEPARDAESGSKPDANAEITPPDAPMPEGFPEPTPAGTIEVKSYPAYRSAVAEGENMNQKSGDMLFFWLFRHIKEREIAMTAPVINTYVDPDVAADPSETGDLTMEFLYERPDQGEPGSGIGPVKVKDFPPMTVVALGHQGKMTPEVMAQGVQRLKGWMAEHQDEWAAAGPPRRLGYHGPVTPETQRHWEIQVPIQPADQKPARPKAAQESESPQS